MLATDATHMEDDTLPKYGLFSCFVEIVFRDDDAISKRSDKASQVTSYLKLQIKNLPYIGVL